MALVLPLILATVGVIGTIGAANNGAVSGRLTVGGVALLLVGALTLWWRRQWPVGVAIIVCATSLAYLALDQPHGPYVLLPTAALGNAMMRGDRRAALALSGVAFALLWLVLPLRADPGPLDAVHFAAVAGWFGVTLAVGELARQNDQRLQEQRRTREAEQRRVGSEERLRMAQDLHDVLAHNLSLIKVQSGVALHLIEDRPEQAGIALAAINDASTEALGEVRYVLAALRQDRPAPREPATSLDDLPRLVGRATTPHLDVQLVTEGPLLVPASVGHAAYRIVQESITNVTRHADAGHVRVVVRSDHDGVTLSVEDDGRRTQAAGPAARQARRHAAAEDESGTGLQGMQARAEALGGWLQAGPRDGGGFAVRAWLPITPVPS